MLSTRGDVPNLTQPSSSGKPISSSSSTQKSPSYSKDRAQGDQIPQALAQVLRAGFKGFKSVPDPNNAQQDIKVPVFNIPPKQIARLLIGLESNFFHNAPTFDNLSKPLRDRYGIANFQVNDQLVLKHINVIEHIVQPFMQRMFGSNEAEQARVDVIEQFDAFVRGPYKHLLQTEQGKGAKQGTIENLSFREQFQPVIQPLQSFIAGTGRTLESSGIHPDFKLFLQETVKAYGTWAAQQKIPPEDLLQIMKSSLVGLLFIRGLLPVWNDRFVRDMTDDKHAEREWTKFKAKLSAQLAHYTSTLFDDFIVAIIASTEGKSAEFDQYFKPIERAAELRRKEAMGTSMRQEKAKRTLTRGATVSTTTSDNTEKKPSLSQLFAGLVSPRKKDLSSETAQPTSPRGMKANAAERVESASGILLKKTESRATHAMRSQKKELDTYLKSTKLPLFDPGYIRYLNKAIATRKNYTAFESAPAAFCLKQFNQFLEDLRKNGEELPSNHDQIQKGLSKLVKDERIEIERAVKKSRQTASANPSSASTTKVSDASPVFVPPLDFAELKKSPFDEDVAEANEATESSKTEPSDSTEVETESSEGNAVLNEQKEKITSEKTQQ